MIEIDIVLTDELINYRVVIAPVVFPFVAAVSYALEICLRKRDRCPERLGPYPEGESLYAVLFGNGNTPVDVASQAERHEGFSCTEAYLRLRDSLASRFPVCELVEDYAEHLA